MVKNATDSIIYHDRVRAREYYDALIRPETDSEVASKLGVSRRLVSEVIKNTTDSIIYHDRVKAREYYEENPDASYREVARQVDASNKTVTEWLKEDFDSGSGYSVLIQCEYDLM